MLESVTKQRDKNSKYGGAMALPVGTKMTDIVEISLRDQIIELEEKIYIGTLGNLKVYILNGLKLNEKKKFWLIGASISQKKTLGLSCVLKMIYSSKKPP